MLLVPVALTAQTRVLFLGNSYTAVNDLPGVFDSLCSNGGEFVVTSSVTPGGFTFQQHVSNAASLTALSAQLWNFVVLQEQSQKPSFSPAQVATEVYPYARQLDSLAGLADTCTRTVFYMTWGRKNGDAMNCPSYPPVCTYAGMQQRLRDSYLQMGTSNNAIIAPAGVAWQRSILNDSTLNLYDPDESHPNYAGTYLTACVMYATLFQKDPLQLTWDGTLPSATAAYLRGIASLVVLDSLDQWNADVYEVKAQFGQTINQFTVNFSDSSQNALSWQWAFGDGNTDTVASPQHSYTTPGTYTVQLIVSAPCGTDTATAQVVIADTVTTDIQQMHAEKEMLRIFPNPSGQFLMLEFLQENNEGLMYLLDYSGKLIREFSVTPGTHPVRLDVSGIPSGNYLLRFGQQAYPVQVRH